MLYNFKTTVRQPDAFIGQATEPSWLWPINLWGAKANCPIAPLVVVITITLGCLIQCNQHVFLLHSRMYDISSKSWPVVLPRYILRKLLYSIEIQYVIFRRIIWLFRMRYTLCPTFFQWIANNTTTVHRITYIYNVFFFEFSV